LLLEKYTKSRIIAKQTCTNAYYFKGGFAVTVWL